jgi:predicted TPR repeat methyltransferase
MDDEVYFRFRLAELQEQVNGDHAAAAALMQQVAELYPNTRHAANANHRLQELGQGAEAAALAEHQNLAQVKLYSGVEHLYIIGAISPVVRRSAPTLVDTVNFIQEQKSAGYPGCRDKVKS